MLTTRALLLLSLLAASLVTHTARAEGTEVYMQVKAPDPKDPKVRDKAPQIEAIIIDGQKLGAEKYTISTTNQGQKVSLKAEKFRDYVDGNEPIAIVLVISGQEIWIGNDDYETDENAKYAGVLKNLEAAIDKMGLASAGPAGSKGAVVSYSTGAEIKVQLSDLKVITGGALGSQKDYSKRIGSDLVQGITLGLAQLSNATTPRKALIVVGDGTDTSPDTAKTALVELKKQAKLQNIQLFGIIYKSAVSGDAATVITGMIPNAKSTNSIEGIAAELTGIIERMKNRFYLTFPGWDEVTQTGLPWDGKDHDLVIKVDQTELDPVTLTMTPKWAPPKGGFPWLVLVLVGVGALLLIILGVKVFGSKPAPMPVALPVAAAPEAPRPAGPMKTVMIGAGGDQEGFPIVGWLVALNGADAYRTQRLKPGLTKIGTAPPSDLVINDGFMSTEHCQITCSPAGFVLQDSGSTNGCYVNDRKVQKHDLVDNDTITLGKTNFKFKSIN